MNILRSFANTSLLKCPCSVNSEISNRPNGDEILTFADVEVEDRKLVNKVEAYITTDCIMESEVDGDDNSHDEVVVIGEGEDHRYYCVPTSSPSSLDEHEHSAARCHKSRDNDDAAPNDVEKPMKKPNVYVQHDRTWKFQKTTVIATCNENGQLLYHPDPFSPVPPFKGSPSAVKRMEYAARRIDSRKYRAQRNKVLASDNLNSAACSKCHMRFFLPFHYFKSRITYLVPENPHLLPMPQFHCPLCGEDSVIDF